MSVTQPRVGTVGLTDPDPDPGRGAEPPPTQPFPPDTDGITDLPFHCHMKVREVSC